MTMQNRLRIAGAVAWPLALLVLMAGAPAHAAESVALATAPVQSAVQGERLSFDGVVEAVRQTTVSAQVPGSIVALSVKAGDRVKAGQELVRIDARAASQNASASLAQVDAAQAAMAVAAKDYDRQKQLFQKQYISQAALDRAQAQFQATQAQVQALQAQAGAAQTQSGFYSIKAPYAGVVSEVPVALGDMAMPGRPLLTLHDPSELRVTVAVPQSLANEATAQKAQLELPGLASGLITPSSAKLLPVADAATHTTALRLGLPSMANTANTVSPGSFARVWLSAAAGAQAASADHLYVPRSALVRRAELTGVYVVDAQGRPALRQVRAGPVQGDRIEILTGVQAGEKVATDPQAAAKVR